MATSWYAVPGERRFSPEHDRRGRDRGQREDGDREQREDGDREDIRSQVNQFTLPPESVLIRRMHGIVAIVLGQLRAGADWGAIASEYLHGEPAATSLGSEEADFFLRRGRGAAPSGREAA
jgi:hypothetical protein